MKQFSDSRYALMSPNAPFSPSAFDALFADGQNLGSATVPLDNTADDPRRSATTGGTGRLAHTFDRLKRSGITFGSSLNGAENEVTPDLTSWLKGPSTPDVIDNGDGSFRVKLPAGAGTFVYTPLTFTDDDYSVTLEFRQTPGESSDGELSVQSRAAGDVGTFYEGAATAEWQLITGTDNTLSAATSIYILDTGGAIDIEVRAVRLVKSAIAHAAFPVGSPANTVYVDDGLSSASVTYDGNTTIYICRKTYGVWVDSDNPNNAQPVLYKAGDLEIRVNAGGFIETSGGAISTKKSTGLWQSIIVKVGGGNHSIQVEDETPVVNASALVPSGTTYAGNNDVGTLVDHSVSTWQVYPRLTSSTEDDILRAGNESIAEGIILE